MSCSFPGSRIAGIAGVIALAAFVPGCSDSFLTEEMDLDGEPKPRPIGIVVEPPEAAPGETVTVSYLWHQPDGSAVGDVAWRVALEYETGQYGPDRIERRVVPLPAAGAPEELGDGFLRQSFTYVVPDSVLHWAPAWASLSADPLFTAVVDAVLPGVPTARRQAELADLLAGLTEADVAGLDPASREMVMTAADLFGAHIRFHARMTGGIDLDVARTITVRHGGRLGSPNRNANAVVAAWSVVGIPREDADWTDHDAPPSSWETTPILGTGRGDGIATGDPVAASHRVAADIGVGEEIPVVVVPRRAGWTYYLVLEGAPQTHRSPFSGMALPESHSQRWYWATPSGSPPDHILLVDDDGEETDMGALDETVRLEPPTGSDPTRFRIAAALRDHRPEWERYNASPGLTIALADVIFE